MIKFQAADHSYTSIVPDNRKWISITAIVGMLHEKFDKVAKAQSCSTRKPGRWPNKWYGLTPQQILDAWEGEKMMLGPVGHLGDCEFYHYAIQLSLYAYCILKHNPQLKLQELVIEHIKFEIEGEGNNGYPIYKRDSNGEFIVREIEEIQLPYLAKECQSIITWLKQKG